MEWEHFVQRFVKRSLFFTSCVLKVNDVSPNATNARGMSQADYDHTVIGDFAPQQKGDLKVIKGELVSS